MKYENTQLAKVEAHVITLWHDIEDFGESAEGKIIGATPKADERNDGSIDPKSASAIAEAIDAMRDARKRLKAACRTLRHRRIDIIEEGL